MFRLTRAALIAVTIAIATIVSISAAQQSPSAPQPEAQDADVVGRFLAYSGGSHAYRAMRHMEASGGGLHAWIDAETDYTPAGGLTYEVTAQGGAGIIRSRVLVTMLEEEKQLIARGATGTVALSPANYRFTAAGGDDEGLARIAIEPLRNERALILGTLFVRPENGELVRLTGRLAKNPSFWTKRVDVVRRYERINGVLMPVRLESAAQLRLFGKSTMNMTYAYSSIDDQPATH